MKWRYQPVWGADQEGNRWYALCEVYLDDQDRLEKWTKNPMIAPFGDDLPELRLCLARMLADAWKWRPVPFSELRVGMRFQRAITQEECETIAQLIGQMASSAGALQGRNQADVSHGERKR